MCVSRCVSRSGTTWLINVSQCVSRSSTTLLKVLLVQRVECTVSMQDLMCEFVLLVDIVIN